MKGTESEQMIERIRVALEGLFVGDSLAMPVHWYYNRRDIFQAFPGGISKLEAAPKFHPSSIMSLHSTSSGGRSSKSGGKLPEVVGGVILKGRRQYWDQPNIHYHHQLQAGENTLNAHCARVVLRSLVATGGHYDKDRFLDDYIDFMTADPPRHRDTYAESYHRGFFANLLAGKPRDRCGAVTHDTSSVGGLVTIAPILFAERLNGTALSEVQKRCREHLFLTHPDETLAAVCAAYVELLDGLLFRSPDKPAADFISAIAQKSCGLDLAALVHSARDDSAVVGGSFSPACYIEGAWPSLLYLAFKYRDQPDQALLANTNLGGDNVHRGAVLGVILGLARGEGLKEIFQKLVDHAALTGEINALIETASAEGKRHSHKQWRWLEESSEI